MNILKNKKAVARNARLCRSALSKARGLMFSKPGTLVLEFKNPRRISLHMFFVFFPIDLFFLDERKKIIEIKENFRPFTIYNSQKKAKYIIESPSGSMLGKISIGDKLEF